MRHEAENLFLEAFVEAMLRPEPEPDAPRRRPEIQGAKTPRITRR